MYGTNLSRCRASGACELMVDLLKAVADLAGVFTRSLQQLSESGGASENNDNRRSATKDLKSLTCGTKAALLAALRLCEDSSNVQRMRSRGIGGVLSSQYYSDSDSSGLSADLAIEQWRERDFWRDLTKDSALYINCFGKTIYCQGDVVTICRDLRRKIQEAALLPRTTSSNR